jgi:hypothetical protein
MVTTARDISPGQECQREGCQGKGSAPGPEQRGTEGVRVELVPGFWVTVWLCQNHRDEYTKKPTAR